MSTATATATATVYDLRAEYGDQAVVGSASPRLSWKVRSEGAWSQHKYEIGLCHEGDVGAVIKSFSVESTETVLVAWPLPPLASRDRIFICIRSINDVGNASEWSSPLAIQAGLLSEKDWSAQPITAVIPNAVPEQPVRFRKEFVVDDDVVHATLYSSAYGIYNAVCNGTSVNDELLAPGWTSYSHRLRYQTTDVTALVKAGANVLGFTVSEGWFRGRIGFEGGKRDVYGSEIGPIAQLELEHNDGTITTIITDNTWRANTGPITWAGLYGGERYDARLQDVKWSLSGYDDSQWHPVTVLPSCAAILEAPLGPPVRRIETLHPISVTQSPTGKTLVDFGQNFSGWLRINVTGPTGTTITLRHAEVLELGELGTRPLRGAEATDTYILAGDENGPDVETYEPTFTIHGFRYAEVTGWPGTLTLEAATAGAIEAIVVHSDMRPTGNFRCSHDGLNKLHDNVRWSMRGNFVDLPTDCPQRDERLGWTGDLQVFAPTASYLYDCDGFLASWLADVAHEQADIGFVPPYVPHIALTFPAMPFAAWGDAATIVPWHLYARFGNLELLRNQYVSMRSWVDSIAARLDAAKIWSKDPQLGDWLDPTAPPENPAAAKADGTLIATAHHVLSTRIVAAAAKELGEQSDADKYAAHASAVSKAFVNEYVTGSGRLSSDAVTAYAVALQFDLLPTSQQRDRAAARLAELVSRGGHHIATGFVGTPLVCDALANHGYLDDAYILMLQTECPSWLYPVSMGATTIWERWDSMLADGSINPGDMTSFNHYALGAVADFMHRTVGGLSAATPDGTGSRAIRFAPRPGGGLTHAQASLETSYGLASIAWRRDADWLYVDVIVPSLSTAVVALPNGKEVTVAGGSHHFECQYRPAEEDPTTTPKRNFLGQLL
jgi:alpha-L-rhamnosidase